MKIFPTSAVHEIDAYTISHEPVASIDLMERAATALYDWISAHIPKQQKIVVFAGSGNNGGDALAVSRMLSTAGYLVRVCHVMISDRLSPNCAVNLERISSQKNVILETIREGNTFPTLARDEVVIEGLFGSGLNRPLDGLAARVVKHINASGNRVISIDIPSGLFGEDNRKNNPEAIIKAAITLTLQFPKLSFFLPENEVYTGRWEIIPIGLHPDAIASGKTSYYFTQDDDIIPLARQRKVFSHKGNYGHALLIAGCYGRMGAAILASRSCLRTGVGLLTTHVPRYGNDILQTAVPEAMISLDQSDILFSNLPDLSAYSAIGAGPAMGCRQNSQKALFTLLETSSVPLVLDADAINILSQHPEWQDKFPPETILTPHPKEFDRMTGPSANGWERLRKGIDFSVKHSVILVLKGAYTAVISPDGTCYFNSTGNPGMATAGSGDVLTGIILSLLAQHYPPLHAARLGVFLHGLSGDIAGSGIGQEALIASDITDHLGKAFTYIMKMKEDLYNA